MYMYIYHIQSYNINTYITYIYISRQRQNILRIFSKTSSGKIFKWFSCNQMQTIISSIYLETLVKTNSDRESDGDSENNIEKL